MGMEKHAVKLTPKEREGLVASVTKGRNKATYIQRAHILLKSDEGKTDREIGEMLYISEQTIRRTRLRFWEDGLEAALEDKARPKRDGALNERQQAYLVALACSNPPSGRERWTVELLAAQLVDDGIVTSIAPETVRVVLEKTNSNPGASEAGACPS
jgi:transposase